MHWIAKLRIFDVAEAKRAVHIIKETILQNQRQMFVDMLESLGFVMKLRQRRLGRHLPVDAIRFALFILAGNFDPDRLEKPLAGRPGRSCCVYSLQLHSDEIRHLAVLRRDKKVIHAAARNGDFGNFMQFFPNSRKTAS